MRKYEVLIKELAEKEINKREYNLNYIAGKTYINDVVLDFLTNMELQTYDKKEIQKDVINYIKINILKIDEELENSIERVMRNYYGDRYYNEYSSNPVTGYEFQGIKNLIFECIKTYKEYKQ
jgi:hypothetical protein